MVWLCENGIKKQIYNWEGAKNVGAQYDWSCFNHVNQQLTVRLTTKNEKKSENSNKFQKIAEISKFYKFWKKSKNSEKFKKLNCSKCCFS
jgi:hypothetical protein